jgi:hypothetical protein
MQFTDGLRATDDVGERWCDWRKKRERCRKKQLLLLISFNFLKLFFCRHTPSSDFFLNSLYSGHWKRNTVKTRTALLLLSRLISSVTKLILLRWKNNSVVTHFITMTESFQSSPVFLPRTILRWRLVQSNGGRSQDPRGIRRGSATARLLGLRVWIMLGAWMSVCCECCMLSGRGLCVGLITCPEESYWVWCVWVWSLSLDNDKVLTH